MRKILNIKVLIIDEISMLHANTLDMVEEVLRQARKESFEEKPFGGIQVVFVGDFFQLPPVSKKAASKFAFEGYAWKSADPVVCYLTEQHRQEDDEFLKILTAMRSGKVKPIHKKNLANKSSKELQPTRLFTHNLEVDAINNAKLLEIDGEEREFVMECSGVPYLVEVLKKSCLSPEHLKLRVGAVVMFTRNNFEEEYVNGTLGTVVEFADNDMPVVETKDGRRITARYAEWSIEDTVAVVSQVPLRLAWAITVHKSQGMSLDSASIDLSKTFEYGQGYVALSRVRSLKGLHLEGINDLAFEMHPRVVEQDKIFRQLSDNIDK